MAIFHMLTNKLKVFCFCVQRIMHLSFKTTDHSWGEKYVITKLGGCNAVLLVHCTNNAGEVPGFLHVLNCDSMSILVLHTGA